MIFTDLNPIHIAANLLWGIRRIDQENFDGLIRMVTKQADCTPEAATRAAVAAVVVNMTTPTDFNLPEVKLPEVKVGNTITLVVSEGSKWISVSGLVDSVIPVNINKRSTQWIGVINALGKFVGMVETAIVLDASDKLSAFISTRNPYPVNAKEFIKVAKRSILKALTEEFDHGQGEVNQPLFDAVDWHPMFHNTDLTMVMDKVVLGLYLALNESQGNVNTSETSKKGKDKPAPPFVRARIAWDSGGMGTYSIFHVAEGKLLIQGKEYRAQEDIDNGIVRLSGKRWGTLHLSEYRRLMEKVNPVIDDGN